MAGLHLFNDIGKLRRIVLSDVSHHANKNEVNRAPKRFPHRHVARVIMGVKVDKSMHTATGKKSLFRIGRILAIHGGVKHVQETAMRRRYEKIERPLSESIVRMHGDGPQCIWRDSGIVLV